MIVYRIRHWSKHFEHNKSRGIKACRYVCMPNKQDGLGLTRILAQPDGAAIFGVWCLILQACSRQTERDGWLTDDGTPNGRPWDLEDLGFRWRRPRAEIERCIATICDHKIGWMEALESKCPPSGTTSPRGALERRERLEGRERADAADASPHPKGEEDREELFEPSTSPTLTPEDIAYSLVAYVNWRTKDVDRQRANVATLATLAADHTPPVVMAAAKAISDREKRSAWVNELLPEILGSKPDADADPYAAKAKRLIALHGWERCRDASGIKPERITSESVMLQAMTASWDLCDAVAAKLGAA